MLSFDEARNVVERHASAMRPAGAEFCALAEVAGRVLAAPLTADRDLPPFPRATRDGYALRSAEIQSLPAVFNLQGEIAAGVAEPELKALEGPKACVAIMTGAPLPEGADCVLMVEHSRRLQEGRIEALCTLSAGENVVPRGAEARQGSQLLAPAMVMTPAAVALAAAVGAARISVYRRPRVAVLTTGSELVEIHEKPAAFQIRNSNAWSLAAQLRHAGAEPVILRTAPDEPARLRALLAEALGCEMALISGGVSMGKYDIVEAALAEFDARFLFTGVAMQPGRPVVFCNCARPSERAVRVPVFGLPGNPVSTMVCFEVLARTAVEALTGQPIRPLRFLQAPLACAISHKPGLRRFLPAVIEGSGAGCSVRPLAWQGSGDVAASARAGCFIVVDEKLERAEAGQLIPVLIPGTSL